MLPARRVGGSKWCHAMCYNHRYAAADEIGCRLFALAFTVNATLVPEETVSEVEEGVSQFGTPNIE